MTVKELKKALKGYDDTDEVFIVLDWDELDEDGHLVKLGEIRSVTEQNIIVDMGLDFDNVTQVLLEADILTDGKR